MQISESDRRDIFVGLESILGDHVANNLMQLLPYQPADQLVTRADMHAQTALLQGEMAELRSELRGEMAELRADLTSELRGEITDLKLYVQRWMGGAAAANAVALVVALAT